MITVDLFVSGIGRLTQGASGVFETGIGNISVGSLTGAGTVRLNAPRFAVGADDTDFQFDGVIEGDGGVDKAGSGTFTLTGSNIHTGLTRVFGGTLAITATGSLEGPVQIEVGSLDNAGTIGGLITNGGTLTSTGVLNGGLDNNGTGIALLSGIVNGDITNSATITFGGPTTGIGAVSQLAGGVIDLAGNAIAFGSLSGAGSVELGTGTLTVGSSNASTRFAGTISGSGGLTKTGSGALVLTAAQSFTGVTTVAAGRLELEQSGSLAGGVVNNAGVVLLGGFVGGQFVNNGNLSALGQLRGGLVNTAGARAVLGSSVGGDIANAGAVVLTPGTRDIGAVTQTATGVFDLFSSNTAIGSLAGSGSVLLGSGTLTLGGNNADTSFAGVIAGTGGLIKTGTGTLTLSGVNSFTGMTTISGGTLALTGALAGGVTNNAALIASGTIGGGLRNNGAAQVAGTIGGAVTNTGTITLTGGLTGITALDQAVSGLFDLAGFRADIGALGGAGRIALGGGGLISGSDTADSLFSGVISGSGTLTKVGTGTLVLTGANTYTGGTTINAGVLQLGDGGTGGIITGAIVTNAALVINRSDAVTLANAISGTGMLVQDGPGTTTLTGANSYSGGTVVRGGRLVGSAAVLQGTIQNDAVLEFAQANAGTFGGALLGSGRTEKTGASVLTYTGNGSGLTGTFAVLGGGLRLDGRLDNAVVTLAAGTQLSGNGVMGGLVVSSGAVVAPGASVGRLGVLGDVTFQSGSRLVAEVTQTGADLIAATGTARLAGALEVINIGGADYIFNSAFDLLSASDGVTGAFDTVSFAGFDSRFRPTLRTTATGLQLVLAPNSLAALAGTGLSGNQAAVAARFDAAVLAGFNPLAFGGVYDLAPAQLAGALDQLSGEIHPAMGRAAMRQSRLPREAVLERAANSALAQPGLASWGGWGKLIGSWGNVDGDGSAAAQDSDTEGFVIGFDGGNATDGRTVRAGFYGSYLDTRIAIGARGSSGRIEQTGGGVYASLALGGLSLMAGGGAAHFDVTTQRSITVPGLADATSSGSTGDMAQVFGRIGYAFDLGAMSLEPFVAGDHAWIALDSAAERGGAAALVAGPQDYKVAGTTAGIAARLPIGKLRIDSELAARFELGDRAPQALIGLAAAPGQATRIASTRLNAAAYTGRIGAVLPIGRRIELRIDYSGEFSGNDTQHAALAGLSIAF